MTRELDSAKVVTQALIPESKSEDQVFTLIIIILCLAAASLLLRLNEWRLKAKLYDRVHATCDDIDQITGKANK